jgi:hypothetical protein
MDGADPAGRPPPAQRAGSPPEDAGHLGQGINASG